MNSLTVSGQKLVTAFVVCLVFGAGLTLLMAFGIIR